MTTLQELTREFGSNAVASAIIESLLDSGLEIRSDSVRTLRRGHTGARLAKALLANVAEPHKPRWCVIKFCPPVQDNRRRESRLHSAALLAEPREFGQGHLADIAFPPVRGPEGVLVIGQSKADGIPLGAVELGQLADVCETIWREMLFNWTGDRYDYKRSTVAELLMCELGASFETDGWLRDWALRHGLLTPAFLQLPGEDTPLPNPWRLFTEDTPATREEIDCLVGRTHGDLHGDNVLVPEHNKIVEPARFRLIDLATYDPRAPLSRDLATLLISLCWHQIGASAPDSQLTYLAYLEGDKRDESLDDGMPGNVRKIIDALREPALQFVDEKSGDSEQWFTQVKVSLLAQAMLHSAYRTGPPDARRWCARLAGRLTRVLLKPMAPSAALAMPFDAGKAVEATSRVSTRATGRPAPGRSGFVDRTDQRSLLRAALEDQVTSVVLVSGPPGIGKTALVREVLADMGWADPDEESSAVRWHDATPYGEIGVPTLVEDIEPPGSGRIAGPYARARLEIALDSLEGTGGVRPVIVIDSAENLLKDSHVLRDSELDLALEAVQRRPHPLVKVIFVTQRVPEATSGVAWTEEAFSIRLEGLEVRSLREHFAALDPGNKYGLAALPEYDLRRVHGRLGGNPRLAELLHAILSSDPTGLPVREVGGWLSSLQASEVHQCLVLKFVDRLPVEQQRAAESLAALGVPVETEAVVGILDPYVPGPRIEQALRALVAAGLVLERRDGRRYLRKSEIGAILSRLAGGERVADEGEPPTRRELLARAATVLRDMQKDKHDVHGMVDLDMHFARVDLWLRAGMYQEAHSVIDSMDELVRRWGSGAELRTQREAVHGQLGDDRESEMMNLAALGDIYSYSGEFSFAQSAFTAALAIAKGDQNREAIRKIHINMGYMFWEHGQLAEAEERYGWALGLAGEDDDEGGDRAAALTGLAECRQRQGNYRRAIMDALSAFEAARDADPDAAFDVALRLAKWYADLDRIPDALTMLARCDELITARPNPSRQAKLLSLKAELHIYRDRYGEARTTVERAIDIARNHRDPIALRRALTVLALTHMHMRDFPAARKEIEESARYRVAGKDISDLALRGIIAHRCGFPGTARDLFQQLHDETNNRTRADANDLVAWDFTGIARCYSVLFDDEEPARALDAFRRARPESAQPTPGLDDLLRFMAETLAAGDPRLEPVLTELARLRPGRAG
ncbi:MULTISPECIES: tetratricopeptide repeat protein [unclassified Streptomyces]|jgi:tetratricopeptide (TPR) repeat protein|uniref:tetratricopeptide repeat protein n=1 Tax=unclassified Streptomyces TaxID=2593676 RepID=UPI000FFF3258|nr:MULTISPECIES: tetratricopeptide repeat protein [unclassified Streptomyces]